MRDDMPAKETIRAYYDAFNRQDMEAFLDLLHDDVIHDINQGGRQVGKDAFRDFMAHMNRSYRETLTDIVIMSNDDGLPEANGQTYILPAGAFFEIRDGKVARISNTYNLNDWIAQVGA
jgi:ketosteroid isomerase-like protein